MFIKNNDGAIQTDHVLFLVYYLFFLDYLVFLQENSFNFCILSVLWWLNTCVKYVRFFFIPPNLIFLSHGIHTFSSFPFIKHLLTTLGKERRCSHCLLFSAEQTLGISLWLIACFSFCLFHSVFVFDLQILTRIVLIAASLELSHSAWKGHCSAH